MRRGFWARRLRERAPIAPAAPISVLPLAALMLAGILTAAPARAQTYDPDYPVCLHTHAIGGSYIDCSYVSQAQCGMTASGLPAQCIVNPYFAGALVSVGGRDRRHRRAY
jgi:Protein of unknown function (DUF3551)